MTDLDAWQQRVADVAAFLFERVPPEVVEECRTLIALDPSCAGVRLHHDPDRDLYSFVWVGRWLGDVPGPWLRDGTGPAGLGDLP